MLNLNLISKSRPDQVKLVGRVTIDLADASNYNTYANEKNFKLMYCAIDASISFKVALTNKG